MLEVVSFVLLCRFNSYQGSVTLSAANSTAAAIGGLYDDAKAYFQLGEINADLTQRNLQLQIQTSSCVNVCVSLEPTRAIRRVGWLRRLKATP